MVISIKSQRRGKRIEKLRKKNGSESKRGEARRTHRSRVGRLHEEEHL
jgi:hypothetical protein